MATRIYPCLLVQDSIAMNFDKLLKGTTLSQGILGALTSPSNTEGFSYNQIDGVLKPITGGKRIIQLRGINPSCESEGGACATECDIDAEPNTYFYDNIEVNECDRFSFSLTETEFAEACAGRTEIISEAIGAKFKNFLKQISANIATKVAPYMSTIDGVDTVTNPIVVPFVATNGTPNVGAFAFADAKYIGIDQDVTPFYVGGGLFAQIAAIKKMAMRSPAGVLPYEYGSIPYDNIYFDNTIDGAINNGLQNVLSWAPGTIQLVTHLDNRARKVSEPMSLIINGKTVNSFKKQLETVVVGDLELDFYYEYDCGTHKFVMQLPWDIYALPTNALCTEKYPAIGFANVCGDIDVCGSVSSL